MTGPARSNLRRRLLSGLVGLLSAVGIAALFGVGATVGLVAHLSLPAGRRVTAEWLGATLADIFQGQVVIGGIVKLTPGEVTAEDIVVRDLQHRNVLKLTRLTAEADIFALVQALLRGSAKLTLVVNHVRVERAEADLIPAEDGIPTLAHALMPREHPTTTPATPPEQYVRVWLPAIELGQVYVRGQMRGTPTLEAEVTGAHASVLASPKGAAIDVGRFALLLRGLTGADAKGVATLHIRAPGAMWTSFDGYLGEVQFGSTARFDKDALDIKLDLPRAEPAATRALFKDWPLLVSAEGQVHVKGHLPDLDVDARFGVGDHASVTGSGDLNVADPLRLRLNLQGRELDLRALWATAPQTSINVDTELGLQNDQGKLALDFNGTSQPTRIGQVDVPPLEFSAGGKGGGLTGEAKVHDRGLPLDLGFSVSPDGKLELDAQAQRISLEKVERLKPYVDAKGTADVKVHAAFDHGKLDSNLTLDVRSVAWQGATLQSGRVTAGAKGSLDKLDQLAIDARLTGKKLTAGRFKFEDVSAAAKGPWKTPNVSTTLKDPTGPSVDAKATLSLNKPLGVRELSLGIARNDVEIRGDVARVDVSDDRVSIQGLKVRGASGELNGDAELLPESLKVQAAGENLDLSAFSKVLGLPRGIMEGRASLRADVQTSAKSDRGSIDLKISQATLMNVSGVSGQLNAKLDDRKLTGSASGKVEAFGGFSGDWDAELAGPPTKGASFEHATGSASLTMKDVTLEYLGQLLPSQGVDVTGQAEATLKLSRTKPTAVPNIELSAQTHGLSVQVDHKPMPILVSGMELSLSASHEGETGNTSMAVGVDQGGARLVAASADMTLDLAALAKRPESLEEQLKSKEIAAKLVVSRVDLDSLPDALRVSGLHGSVRLEGTVQGTLQSPTAALSYRASDLTIAANGRAEPIDVCGTAEYARDGGGFNVGAELFMPTAFDISRTPCSGKRIATLRFAGNAPYDPNRGIPGWTGTATASLESLPLQVIPALADARVTGVATGTISLDQNGRDPSASALLKLGDLRVDRLIVGDGSIKLRSDRDHASVDFELERTDSKLNGRVSSGLTWREDLPAIDDAAPIDVELHATKLEASVLEPLLDNMVSELRGRLDGEVSARLLGLKPGEQQRAVAQIGGNLRLSEGAFVLTGLGFRLREVSFHAEAKRDGDTTLVSVPDFKANVGAPTPLQSNIALRLSGFDIVTGSATLNVEGLPLVVDGVTRATADINIGVRESNEPSNETPPPITIKRNPGWMFVDVPFHKLDVKLSQEETRTLIELNENNRIQVLQPIAEPKAQRDDAALPWQFAIHLGNKAKVERGAMLDLPVNGNPNVTLASGLGVTGAIMLEKRGAVQMLGKIFQIEGGAVVFDTPDPADPRLDVRASWRTPDGDALFMYVSGTISKPKVDFDRPRDSALALLLGGDGGTTNLGISALDTLLADTPLAHVQLRGEDSTAGTTYTAAVRASDKVIVEGNYRANTAAPTPEEQNTYGATVDYNMGKHVSARVQAGTIGTGVDLVYQYRY